MTPGQRERLRSEAYDNTAWQAMRTHRGILEREAARALSKAEHYADTHPKRSRKFAAISLALCEICEQLGERDAEAKRLERELGPKLGVMNRG